jgi:SAM-dependent methyltransferase
VEPNPDFVVPLRKRLSEVGRDLEEKYTLIVSGIEDTKVLNYYAVVEESIDTVVCMQVLCCVKNRPEVVRKAWELLKPGGMLVFWEHNESSDWLTRNMQGRFCISVSSWMKSSGVKKLMKDRVMEFGMAFCNWRLYVGDRDREAIIEERWLGDSRVGDRCRALGAATKGLGKIEESGEREGFKSLQINLTSYLYHSNPGMTIEWLELREIRFQSSQIYQCSKELYC